MRISLNDFITMDQTTKAQRYVQAQICIPKVFFLNQNHNTFISPFSYIFVTLCATQLCDLVSFPETGLCLRAQKLPTSSSPDEGAAAPVAPDPATMSNYDLFGVANHMGTLRYVMHGLCI